jgi:hypothetical protein
MVLSPECFYGPVMETLPNRDLKNGNVARFWRFVSGNGSGSVSQPSLHLAPLPGDFAIGNVAKCCVDIISLPEFQCQ